MSQEQWLVLLLKVVLITGVVSILAFIGQYTRLAPWYRNPIGRTLVVKDILLVFMFIPSILSLFFHFNRLSSYIAAWVDIVLIGLVTPVMWWRIVVWQKIHKTPPPDKGS